MDKKSECPMHHRPHCNPTRQFLKLRFLQEPDSSGSQPTNYTYLPVKLGLSQGAVSSDFMAGHFCSRAKD
jgi:hypothetical protein